MGNNDKSEIILIIKILKYLVLPIVVTVIGGWILFNITEKKIITDDLDNKQEILSEEPVEQKKDFEGNVRYTIKLRSLEPLETGKKIGEIPNGVYFFVWQFEIDEELEKDGDDWIAVSSVDHPSKFEIQKIDDRYYIVGFISDESHSKLGSIDEESIYTTLFPNQWNGAKNLIAIPFESIYTIKERSIDFDESKSVDALDIGFKAVLENPTIHKIKEL